MDVICQAKSGMGKTAVFVLTTLHQIEPEAGVVSCVVLCHCRELALQIKKDYDKFSKYLPKLKDRVAKFIGGVHLLLDCYTSTAAPISSSPLK